MSLSGTSLFAKKVLLQPKRLISGLRNVRGSQGDSEESEHLIIEECPTRSLHCPLLSPQLQARSLTTPGLDDDNLLLCYTRMVRDIRPSLPSTCRWLGPGDVTLVGEHPIAAGGFTNAHEAIYDGRKVMLKSYRPYVSFDTAQVIARLCNEVHVCTLLRRRNVDVVSLVGVYSNETHPFGLVYEYMDGLDIKQYVKNEPNIGRLKMLAGVARCLCSMHDLGIVHGHLQSANILVDKDGTARIAGLGNAYILPHSAARTVEGRAAKASDVHAFGVVAYEVFAARVAATHSTVSGPIPSRPNHREVSDTVWRIITNCWHNEGMAIGEVATLLQAELSRIPTFDA